MSQKIDLLHNLYYKYKSSISSIELVLLHSYERKGRYDRTCITPATDESVVRQTSANPVHAQPYVQRDASVPDQRQRGLPDEQAQHER